jgi:hypothetical protein
MVKSLVGQDASEAEAVPSSSVPVEVLEAVDDLLVAAAAPAAPVGKKTRSAIKRLGRRLETALATEAKRLRQVEKSRKRLAKREGRAAAAAAKTAALIVRIRDTAREAVNGPIDSTVSGPLSAVDATASEPGADATVTETA